MNQTDDSSRYCLAYVREHRRGHFLAGLFLPEAQRGIYYALTALQSELARVPYMVSESMLGEIRFQWWRDSFDAGSADHPILKVLGPWVTPDRRADLHALIDAYARRLESLAPRDQQEWDAQALACEGTFLSLVGSLSGSDVFDNTPVQSLTARLLWRADMLRSFSSDAALGVFRVPPGMLAEHGLDLGLIRNGQAAENARAMLKSIAATWHDLMADLKLRTRSWPRRELPVLLPLCADEAWVRHALGGAFDPYQLPGDLPAFRLQFRMLRAMALGHL